MPSATTIALFDGQATPVSHNFEPQSIVPGKSIWVNRESDTSAGNLALIVGFDPAKSGRKTNRVTVRFNYPVEHVVDGVTKVSHTARFSADVVLPEEMTQAERDDMAAYVKNVLANAVVNGYMSDLDHAY